MVFYSIKKNKMSANNISSNENLFYQLHHNSEILVLPNIWNPLGALLLQDLGFKAVATASASIACSNGYQDGEKYPFNELVLLLKRITQSVSIPVTADVERGYAKNNIELKENIKRLVDTGILGINFEDSKHEEQKLVAKEEQAERIHLIKNTASEMGSSLFINARTDVFLKQNNLSKEEKLNEAIQRGKLYKSAGADGLYPIFLKEQQSIKSIIDEVQLPINILMLPGIPGFAALKEIGVARVSLGPGFLKYAINSMKDVANKLLNYQGMEEITNNPATSDYLNKLISNPQSS
ncbi:isocitrate lyase/phosphoenolpyruvate mutase family protein [Hanamia caeni]|uniref:Isocitrate lyase/phosphoenolpyruvate mutase family protein n=2 Tax=Hanamia caeni TaxID=2294116 RepID=A0A3M9NMH4_9BACT|nr:isocitrate lyase/phosphoenolpyruvate mutase family protein [Hanamia caeni]